MARACPDVRELRIVHVSLTSVSLPLPGFLTQPLILFCAVPPQNKANAWEEPSLPRIKGYISSFKNLSTITLIHRLESYGWSRGYVHIDWMKRRLDHIWSEITDLAISQLRGSTAGGSKTLKVVTIWGGEKFGPELVMEEVVI